MLTREQWTDGGLSRGMGDAARSVIAPSWRLDIVLLSLTENLFSAESKQRWGQRRQGRRHSSLWGGEFSMIHIWCELHPLAPSHTLYIKSTTANRKQKGNYKLIITDTTKSQQHSQKVIIKNSIKGGQYFLKTDFADFVFSSCISSYRQIISKVFLLWL